MQEEQSGVETKPHSRSWRCLLTGNSKVKLTEKPHFEERGRKSPHMTNECNVDGGNHLQTVSGTKENPPSLRVHASCLN